VLLKSPTCQPHGHPFAVSHDVEHAHTLQFSSARRVNRQHSRSFIFLQWFSNREFNIAEQTYNLTLDAVQADSERTAATAVCVDLLPLLLFEIVFERLNEME
jgi:hypothetical protein